MEVAIAMVQTEAGNDEQVTENDSRVQQKFNEQMELKQEPISLPPSIYIQKIKERIDEIAKERTERGEKITQGRWIVDGFPNTKDDWNAMTELELIPDDLIVIRDHS